MTWDKTVPMGDAVKSFLVRVNEKVDLNASVEKYRAAALTYIAKEESDDTLITQCMTKLFDTYPGAYLNLNFIGSQTVLLMGNHVPELKNPSLHNMLRAKVEKVLHDNTDQPATEAKGDKPAVEAITGRIYGMRKGQGGGFYRHSDRQPESK